MEFQITMTGRTGISRKFISFQRSTSNRQFVLCLVHLILFQLPSFISFQLSQMLLLFSPFSLLFIFVFVYCIFPLLLKDLLTHQYSVVCKLLLAVILDSYLVYAGYSKCISVHIPVQYRSTVIDFKCSVANAELNRNS